MNEATTCPTWSRMLEYGSVPAHTGRPVSAATAYRTYRPTVDTQLAHQYEPPTLTPLGGLTQLTLAPCKSKHADLVPDHVWHYHCEDGNVIVVTSA